MTEAEAREVEKVLLHISDARSRASRAIADARKAGASEAVVDALEESERQLASVHSTLKQRTYYAAESPLRLAV